ncbi:MAG: hypothetical protein Q7K57_15930 [Burkholderiaceae bacterium]|nr:hypothetical protein [Burkholderiaceae bacterium]
MYIKCQGRLLTSARMRTAHQFANVGVIIGWVNGGFSQLFTNALREGQAHAPLRSAIILIATLARLIWAAGNFYL